jgi:hypothetical protein
MGKIETESQRIANQEAMALDIPLLVLDCKFWNELYPFDSMIDYYQPKNGGRPIEGTSVTIWDKRCGIKTTLDTLEADLQIISSGWANYHPREIILEQLNYHKIYDSYLSLFKLHICN